MQQVLEKIRREDMPTELRKVVVNETVKRMMGGTMAIRPDTSVGQIRASGCLDADVSESRQTPVRRLK